MLSVVDLNKVHPFGGPPPAVTNVTRDVSPFQKSHSVRKSFSKEKPSKEGTSLSTTNYMIVTFVTVEKLLKNSIISPMQSVGRSGRI